MRVWGALHYPTPCSNAIVGLTVTSPLSRPRLFQPKLLTSRLTGMTVRLSSNEHGSNPSHSKDAAMDGSSAYETWTSAQLIARVTKLEQQLQIQNEAHANSLRLQKSLAELEHQLAAPHSTTESLPIRSTPSPTAKAKAKREFEPSKYSTRVIALKIAYLGRNYNGYEWHDNNITPLPTIEEELWKALTKTKLIFPPEREDGNVSWEGCEYSKCGRTDKGVSAFGQVISLRVRSNRPKNSTASRPLHNTNGDHASDNATDPNSKEQPAFDEILDEIEYPKLLNRVLPEDIRVLAWCPHLPPEFSARFSCRERRYKYFFTQPAYAPRAGRGGLNSDETAHVRRFGWLNIAKMTEAAQYFVGTHDFRNFCKVDPSKQITNFVREVFHVKIGEAPSCSGMPLFVERQGYGASTNAGHQFVSHAQVFAFTVHGSAFLWHQVRCMVAVLFLIGQGLEEPTLIKELLDVEKNPSKPHYEIADEFPLVLWESVYPADGYDPHIDTLDWVYPDEQNTKGTLPRSGDGRFGPNGLNEAVWAVWRRNKIDEVLSGNLLDIVSVQGGLEPAEATVDGKLEGYLEGPQNSHLRVRVFEGGNGPMTKGEYTPLMKRPKMDTIEDQNSRWANKKGIRTPNSAQKTSFLDIS